MTTQVPHHTAPAICSRHSNRRQPRLNTRVWTSAHTYLNLVKSPPCTNLACLAASPLLHHTEDPHTRSRYMSNTTPNSATFINSKIINPLWAHTSFKE